MARRVSCFFCGGEVQGNYRQVIGWEKLRAQGGANRIIKRTETGEQACDDCGHKLELGLDPVAPTLGL